MTARDRSAIESDAPLFDSDLGRDALLMLLILIGARPLHRAGTVVSRNKGVEI